MLDTNTPIRIAICSVGELFGGVERHILGAIDGLRSSGCDPLLLLFQDGELAAQARLLGAEPIILPWSNKHLLRGARQLAETLRAQDIDVVHVHGYKATFFAGIARYWYRCAMVQTEHGLPEIGKGQTTADFKTRLYHALKVLSCRCGNASICYVTENLRQHLAPSYKGLKQYVIPNAVPDLDRTTLPRPPEFKADRFNLVLVGRLEPVKGVAFAIQALAEPALTVGCHLHILGDGPLADELRTQVHSLQLDESVSFHGFRRDIFAYLAHADALLMPSLHEGLPYTLLEAMAFGTPIIASRVGGLAETLEHENTALLVPPEDSPALAAALNCLRLDPAFARRLGAAGRKVQQARYSLQSMTKQYLEVYRAALAG